MFETYYLSQLGFEMLLSLTVDKDILVPTGNILSSSGKEKVYTELGAMAENGFIKLDESGQKITVKPDVLQIFKEIAQSEKTVVINSYSENGGAICVYRGSSFAVVEKSAFRPDSVKLTLIRTDKLGEYFEDIPWIPKDGDVDASDRKNIFLSADFYVRTDSAVQKKLFAVNEKSSRMLLTRQVELGYSSEKYTLEKFTQIIEEFFAPCDSLGGTVL